MICKENTKAVVVVQLDSLSNPNPLHCPCNCKLDCSVKGTPLLFIVWYLNYYYVILNLMLLLKILQNFCVELPKSSYGVNKAICCSLLTVETDGCQLEYTEAHKIAFLFLSFVPFCKGKMIALHLPSQCLLSSS